MKAKRDRADNDAGGITLSADQITVVNDAIATKGYVVLPRHVPLSVELVKEVKATVVAKKGLGPIFNGGAAPPRNHVDDDDDNAPGSPGLYASHEDCGDQKRKRWKGDVAAFVTRVKDITTHLLPHRRANDHVFLLSEPGCADQAPHTDYDDELLHKRMKDDGVCGGYPVGCLIALEDNTYFNCWPGSINFDVAKAPYPYERLGDVLLFRGDLIHSGAAFEQSNLRIHCFMDVATFKRAKNFTGRSDSDYLAPIKF